MARYGPKQVESHGFSVLKIFYRKMENIKRYSSKMLKQLVRLFLFLEQLSPEIPSIYSFDGICLQTLKTVFLSVETLQRLS